MIPAASPGRWPRSSTTRSARPRWAPRPRCGRGGSRGASRRPGCGGCTPTWSHQSHAARRRALTSDRRPVASLVDGERPARRRRAGRARAADRRVAGVDRRRATPVVRAVDRRGGRGRRRAPLVRAAARRGQGLQTVWLTLGQRTLRYETYVMPAPEENAGAAVRAPAAPQRAARSAPTSRSASRTPCSSAASCRSSALRRGRARPGHRHALRHGRAVLPALAADRLPPLLPRLRRPRAPACRRAPADASTVPASCFERSRPRAG